MKCTTELWARWGIVSSRRTQNHRLVLRHPMLVSEIRSRLCPKTQAASGPPRGYLALGRSLPSNQRKATIPLARRRTILSKAAKRPRQRITLHRYRQTQKLLDRDANDLIRRASHQPTRQRERQMLRFKSAGQAQRFLSLHGIVQNLFRVGRHLLSSTQVLSREGRPRQQPEAVRQQPSPTS